MKYFAITLTFLFIAGIDAPEAKESENWSGPLGPAAGSVWSLHFAPDGTLLAGTLGNGISFSPDNGNNWLPTNLDDVSVFDFAQGKDETLFAATQNGVYRSDNLGRNWTRASTGMDEVRAQSVFFDESGHLFAATLVGGVYVSNDNGNSWSEANEGIPLTFAYALGVNKEGALLAGITNRIFKSGDKGENWTEADSDLPSVRVNVFISNSESVLFAATQAGLYRSDDDGKSWVPADGLQDIEIYDLAAGTSEKLIAATREGVYLSTDNGNTWQPDGLQEHPVYSAAWKNGVFAIGANPGVFLKK